MFGEPDIDRRHAFEGGEFQLEVRCSGEEKFDKERSKFVLLSGQKGLIDEWIKG